MRRFRHLLPALTALAAVSAAVTSLASSSNPNSPSELYKWVDDKGALHYGDSVPTEYAQNERSVLNAQGVEIGHVEGKKNAAQQAEQSAIEAATQQRAQHDRFLLTTYVSAKDIEQLRDERLEQVDGQIRASSTYVDSLSSRLGALQERAMRFKPYSTEVGARPLPDELAEELVHTLNEARSQRQALEGKRKEQSDMRAQFEADIQRYRELTARAHS